MRDDRNMASFRPTLHFVHGRRGFPFARWRLEIHRAQDITYRRCVIAVPVTERDHIECRGINFHATQIFRERDARDTRVPQNLDVTRFQMDERGKAMFGEQRGIGETLDGLGGLGEQIGTVVHENRDGDVLRFAKIFDCRHTPSSL